MSSLCLSSFICYFVIYDVLYFVVISFVRYFFRYVVLYRCLSLLLLHGVYFLISFCPPVFIVLVLSLFRYGCLSFFSRRFRYFVCLVVSFVIYVCILFFRSLVCMFFLSLFL